MFIVLVNDNEGILKEIIHMGMKRDAAEQHFIRACATNLSNWEGYTPEDISAVLENGYEVFGGGCIMFVDTDGFTSDEEIAAMTGGFPPKKVNRITRWEQDGEIGSVDTIDEVVERAGRCLDAANSWDICGPILFQAEDGKWYAGTVNFVISEANPKYVEDTLKELENES